MKIAAQCAIFWFCLSAFHCRGQNAVLDSLKMLLPKAKADTARVMLLAKIGNLTIAVNPAASLPFLEESQSLAEDLDFTKGTVQARYYMSWAYFFLGDYEKSLHHAETALVTAQEGGDAKQLALLQNVLGVTKLNLGNTEDAVAHLFEAAALSEKNGDLRLATSVYNNLGEIYQKTTDFPKAEKYYLKALQTAEASGDKASIVVVYSNLGNVARTREEKIGYIENAIAIGKSLGDNRGLAYSFATLGDLHIEHDQQMALAKAAYQNGLAHSQLAKEQKMIAYCHIHLGTTLLALGMADSALYHLNIGHELASASGQMDYTFEAAYHIGQAKAKAGDFKAAYQWLDEGHALFDSLYRQRAAQAAADADVRFETSKKEAQIAEQQLTIARQQNSQNRLIIGGLVVLVLTAGVFQYFFYQQRRKKRDMELALQAEHAEAERLKQLDEMKTQFFTNVSHELRTPLTLVISPLEEVIKKLRQVNLADELQLALRNSRNLLALVNEVLDLSKLEVGKMEMQATDVELSTWLRRVFFSFQSGADLKGVTLFFETVFPDGMSVKTDGAKLEKILNNLISNALKFTPKGGQVKMEIEQMSIVAPLSDENAQSTSSDFQISIIDTGVGISAEDLPHVFDRFFQSKRTHDAPGGTGIGLALSKQLAKLLGGDLSVQSGLGKGSRFTLTLPLELVTSKSPPAKSLQPGPHTSRTTEPPPSERGYHPIFLRKEKPRILIVEDNPEMATYLQNALSKNYDCTLAADGEEAMRHLHKGQSADGNIQIPDLITSDVMMPNMDGFTLREKINIQPEWRKIPFILLTARTLESDKLKGFQLGIDDYITKPFSLPELEARIFNLLKNKQLREKMPNGPQMEESQHHDSQLLEEAEKIVLEKMDDPSFTVETMAKNLGHSQRQLARVFGKLAGLTPVQFVLELRLQRARQLLENRRFLSVSEVRYEVGIDSASYFTKKFTERFGKNPSEYLEAN